MHFPRRALAALLSAALLAAILSGPALAKSAAPAAPAPFQSAPTQTDPAQPAAFAVEARSALLQDFQSGAILYELNPDLQIPPASLTKLMTMWLANKALRDGKLRREDMVTISQNAWSSNPVFAGSSRMFLEPGMKVTVDEILKGIAIVSGNDACVALAEHMAGTVAAFVATMNEEAKALGLTHTRFVDPHGLSSANLSNARDMLKLADLYIENFSESLAQLHAQPTFAFPQEHNLTDQQKARNVKPIEQPNWNKLLPDPDLKVDGLKTGYLKESGYHFIVTATEGDRRLIGILFGTASEAARAAQGKALLLYGLRNFSTVTPLQDTEEMGQIRVWKGRENAVAAVPARGLTITLPRGDEEGIVKTVELEPELVAPVQANQKVGTVILTVGDHEVGRVDLLTRDEVPAGGFFKRLFDSLRMFWNRLMARFRK